MSMNTVRLAWRFGILTAAMVGFWVWARFWLGRRE